MRAWALALALLGCGGSSSPAPTTDPTALVVEVNYTVSGIDRLHITGVALAQVRPFGPFDVKDRDKVESGATVALLFDPGDAGTVMVCVQAMNDNVERASACGMFAVLAATVTHGELDLDQNR